MRERLIGIAAVVACLCVVGCNGPKLLGFAFVPAGTFAGGGPSGEFLVKAAIQDEQGLFDAQPVQGFSGIVSLGDGTFLAVVDNGFGAIENSADFDLRVYHIRPDFALKGGGTSGVEMLSYFSLSDPDGFIPFAITNAFSDRRVLTGADLDIESIQRAPDGTLWFGDEFGPFLVHTDHEGRIVEPLVRLPDPAGVGDLRSPQSPLNEESSGLRLMNAVRGHARSLGCAHDPVFSPWNLLLDDGFDSTVVPERSEGIDGPHAGSEVFDNRLIQLAGHEVVPWTVNHPTLMKGLIDLGVDGLITDRPDLLLEVMQTHDGDGDTVADLLDADGLVDRTRFDAQGHRGGRGLRPESTLPAFEVALDHFMTTLELDTALARGGFPVVSHDPQIDSRKCRRTDSTSYGPEDEVLIKDLKPSAIVDVFVCDGLLEDHPDQTNDLSLSPVSVAYAESRGLVSPYAMPSLEHVFDFVQFYGAYYSEGKGQDQPDATRRAQNASRVRFNIEIKIDPRPGELQKSAERAMFVDGVGSTIVEMGMQPRCDIQSFDLSSLLLVHEKFGQIRTVVLVDDVTLAPGEDGRDPWLAGLFWPWRITAKDHPFRVVSSGGVEGLAMTPDGSALLPMLEKPLVGDPEGTLIVLRYDVASGSFTDTQMSYDLDDRATAIGDFILVDETRGLVIERDDSQGSLSGFKAVYCVDITTEPIGKSLLVDLMDISDPHDLSPVPFSGDVGYGDPFSFPFWTIESVALVSESSILIVNDSNYPFGRGRHVGSELPDDTEMIVVGF